MVPLPRWGRQENDKLKFENQIIHETARRIVMTRRAVVIHWLLNDQNAQLPSTKMATRSPLSVMAVTERSSVPIMKSTWIMDSLMPMA